ncbi:MAG: hypothetical protein IPG17_27165 [Sandaracinaceae bacterium]|nr:hypothetical protein [Sandaracinaceae bacterium]
MKPQSESLEQKLKRFIEEESLSNAYIAMSAGKAEWEVAEMKIYARRAAPARRGSPGTRRRPSSTVRDRA